MAYQSLTVCLHKRYSKKSCGGGQGEEIAKALEVGLKKMGSHLTVGRIYCFGLCEDGPNVRLTPGGRFFHNVSTDHLDEIFEAVRHLKPNTPSPT